MTHSGRRCLSSQRPLRHGCQGAPPFAAGCGRARASAPVLQQTVRPSAAGDTGLAFPVVNFGRHLTRGVAAAVLLAARHATRRLATRRGIRRASDTHRLPPGHRRYTGISAGARNRTGRASAANDTGTIFLARSTKQAQSKNVPSERFIMTVCVPTEPIVSTRFDLIRR